MTSPKHQAKLDGREGFSLVELLTSIAILALLAAILIPVVSTVRMKADEAKASSDLRQIAAGFHLYSAERGGVWPAARVIEPGQDWVQWTKAVYPYIYPDEPPPTNAAIADPARVFVSPRADPVEHTDGRLGENALRNGNIIGYGYNLRLPAAGSNPKNYGQRIPRNPKLVDNPGSTALLMDCYNFGVAPGSTMIEEASRRWDGHVFVVYCAGNVDKLPLEAIPESMETPEGRVFWSGLPVDFD